MSRNRLSARLCVSVIVTAIVVPISSVGLAASLNPVQSDTTVSVPAGDTRVVADSNIVLLLAGNTSVSASHDGVLGGDGGIAIPPAPFTLQYPDTNVSSNRIDFPRGSKKTHLFKSGVWVGGIIGSDTLVSCALDAASANRHELNASAPLVAKSSLHESSLYDPTAVADNEIHTLYSDQVTADSPSQHQPLGVDIRQSSYTWLSAPYDEFVISEYVIRNTSAVTIQDAYVGIFVDADVFRYGTTAAESSDDLSGFLADEWIAYSIDNDGDPSGFPYHWDINSVRSAIAITPLFVDPAPPCSSFNWWSLGVHVPDWGPSHTDSRPGTDLLPESDAERYAIMANGEIDYDQWESALNHDGWRPPPQGADRIANGSDTRFLVSFGSYSLQPGDSITLAHALLGGSEVHVQPAEYATAFDPQSSDAFRSALDLSSVRENVERARLLYTSNYELIDAAPPLLRPRALSDTRVELQWEPVATSSPEGYQLYRREPDVTLDWTEVGMVSGFETTWMDLGLTPGTLYQYSVAARHADGTAGPQSRPVDFQAALPPSVPRIDSLGSGMKIGLRWYVVSRAGFSSYDHLNVFRRSESETVSVLYDRIELAGDGISASVKHGGASRPRSSGIRPPRLSPNVSGIWYDPDPRSGIHYTYSVSVVNALGLESGRSDDVSLLPMAFDREALVLIDMSYDHGFQPSRLAAREFYFPWATERGYDTFYIELPVTDFSDMYDLSLVSHYKTLVLVLEDAVDLSEPLTSVREWLREYMLLGGTCVFAGRCVPTRFQLRTIPWSRYFVESFEMGSFPHDMLGIREAIVEPREAPVSTDRGIVAPVQLDSAISQLASYQNLTPDVSSSHEALIGFFDRYYPPHPGDGIVGNVGAISSISSDVEVIYTFEAGRPDTSSLQGLPVAIRRIDAPPCFVLFNLPLSVMDPGAASAALDQALVDLGHSVDGFSSTDSNVAQLLRVLYESTGGGTVGNDVNRDGVVDLQDVVDLIMTRAAAEKSR